MRIVLITGSGPQHRYMANRLMRNLPLAGVIVDQGKPRGLGASIKRLLARYTLPQLCGRTALSVLRGLAADRHRRAAQLLAILGEDSVKFSHPEKVQHVEGINSEPSRRAVAALAPDLLLVFGTGIVGKRMTSLPRVCALNVHTGISPEYRGADCSFWPIHNQELDMLGATVHECTEVIDGGRIFATARARLEADDCLFAAYARCVVAAADLYVNVVEQLIAGTIEGQRQDLTVGREYRASERGLRAELRARLLIRRGLIRRFVATRRQDGRYTPANIADRFST